VRDLAPNIVRQRLLIDARYDREISHEDAVAFLREIPIELGLRTYGEPTVHSTGGGGRAINQGYDGFVPLVDSGVSLYVWTNERFMSGFVYTCKAFSAVAAIEFTQSFFVVTEFEYLEL
jgi:hypothetical protein